MLNDSDAKTASRWKLDYIWHLLKKNKWKASEVTAPAIARAQNPVLTLKRLDGITFPVAKCANLFYVIFGDSGLELINIEKIAMKTLDDETSDAISCLLRKKKREVQWCVTYTRCLRTEEAIANSTKCEHVAKNEHGVNRPASLGRTSLRKIWNQDDRRLIFHKGDFPYETAAENIVGFVGWDSAVSSEADSDFKDVLKNISTNLTHRNTSFQVQKAGDMDWVYCGPDFSEKTLRE